MTDMLSIPKLSTIKVIMLCLKELFRRLDAIGAIGIARCFTYGGKVDRVMHDPRRSIRRNTVNEAYKNDQPTTLTHFYERLVMLQVGSLLFFVVCTINGSVLPLWPPSAVAACRPS